MFERSVGAANGDRETISLRELSLSGIFRVGLSSLILDIEKLCT